jgi:hypothetical protein
MSVMLKYIEEQAARNAVAPVAPRDYSEDERRNGLMALVACAGSAINAHRMLKEQNVEIPQSTLQAWKKSRSDEYDALREEWAPKLEAEMVRQYRETIIYAAEVERKAIEAAEKRLDEGKDINPAQTAANMSKVKSSSTDKLQLLLGRPQHITEHRTVEELTRSLVALNVIELVSDDPKELAPGSAMGTGER